MVINVFGRFESQWDLVSVLEHPINQIYENPRDPITKLLTKPLLQ